MFRFYKSTMKITFRNIQNIIEHSGRLIGRIFGDPSLERTPKKDVFVKKRRISVTTTVNGYRVWDKRGMLRCSATLNKSHPDIFIGQLHSVGPGEGYGTRLINHIADKYLVNGHFERLTLKATYIDVGSRLPHQFYIARGFMAEDPQKHRALLHWVHTGARHSEFPWECNGCSMILTKESYLKNLKITNN